MRAVKSSPPKRAMTSHSVLDSPLSVRVYGLSASSKKPEKAAWQLLAYALSGARAKVPPSIRLMLSRGNNIDFRV
jgi:hypothetical protein